MRLLGWSLILLFGGWMVYATTNVVVRSLTGYYEGPELSGAWMILGALGVIALIPIGIGVWLVRRNSHQPRLS